MKNFTPWLKQASFNPILKAAACFLLLLLASTAAQSGNTFFLPTINTHPSSQAVCQGSTTSFTVVASGTGLTYAWQLSINGGSTWNPVVNNSQYSNATTATLTVTAIIAGMTNYQYRCAVSDGAVVNSNAATLTVNGSTAPVVQTFNLNKTICLAGGGSFPAQASSATSYQWQVSSDGGLTWANTTDGATYSGSLSALGTLTILSNGTGLISGSFYHYVATDGSGCSATSSVDTLFVFQPVVTVPTPALTTLTICPGQTSIAATATSPLSLTYQWQLGSSPLSDNATYSGTNTATLVINATPALSTSLYRVSVTDTKSCNTNSGQVRLLVPSVSAGVANSTNSCAFVGVGITSSVTSTGGTFTRQWQTDNGTTLAGGPVVWSNVSGGTLSTLSIAAVSVTVALDGYHYRMIATSATGCNKDTSSEAILHVGSSGTWFGTTDTKWETPTNWCGGVPISTTDVLVPNWAPRMPTISAVTATALWQTIKVASGATLTISGGTYPYNLAGTAYNLPGTVAYVDNANQYILPATHGSLTVGGSANKLLQINTAVTNTLTLGGSAKLVTGTHILDMLAGSNPIAGAAFGAATSWIVTGNGSAGAANTGLGGLTIEQVGLSSGAVLYPIGPTTAYYNPASITNTGTTDNFTLAVNDQPLPGSPVNSGSKNSWLLSELTPGGSNLALQLQWNQTDEQSGYIHSASQIVRSNGTSIMQYTSVLSVGGSDPYATSGGAFSSLTQFSVSSYTLLLPVQLLSFTARRAGAFNQVGWQVDAREQPSAYALERSADGVVFTEITRSTAINDKTTYTYIDKDPGNAVTYYRLRMLTVDNKTLMYSRTVTVTNQQGKVKMELRPSVTNNGETGLFVILPQQTTLTFTLTDAIGRVQLHKSVSLANGEQMIPLNVAFLAKGIYYLRVTGDDGIVKTLSLVKQ